MIYKIDKNLNYKRVRNIKPLFNISLSINFILIIFTIYSFKYPNTIINSKIIKDTVIVEVPEDIKLTDEQITKELVNAGCILPNVALAQAKLETGHYKSQVCKENKNLFGIKKHKCKFVLGENLNHASYKTYKDNIKCYAHIQEHYLKNIDKKYASAPDYIEYVKKVK
jgi:uncharacterized FlgJ-related protein